MSFQADSSRPVVKALPLCDLEKGTIRNGLCSITGTDPFDAPTVPPPLVRAAPPPVPAFETDRELKRQMEIQERLRQIRETKAVTTGGAAVTRARTKETKAAKTASAVPVGLRGALRNHGQVRRAIVLREILGPPLGLR